MTRPKVLLLGEIAHARQAWDSLSPLADLVTPGVDNRAAFLQRCREGGFDGVVAIYRTYYSAAVTGRIDDELVGALPRTVRFISHTGAGYDQIDIAACTARGIQVSHVPSAVDDATADTALFLMLGALRGFAAGLTAVRSGGWRGDDGPLPLGHDPEGKTLGIVGCGGVGRALARKAAAAFGVRVVYHNRRPSSRVTEAEYVSMDELLRTSDVIALSVPLNAHTRHLISHAQFEAMKPGVVLVNTARGPVVDEEALVQALHSGKVWACGLDVFENEPAVHPGLRAHPRALLLPHLGTYTVETHEKMELRCIANVRSALETGKLLDVVPEQR